MNAEEKKEEKDHKTLNVETKQNIDTKTQKSVLQDHGYELIKQIGSGGYANVKTAYSQSNQAVVAIKIISKFKAPLDYLRKFVPRELSVVKGLRHPNIIRYFRSIETTHRVYIVMEYAERGSLLELIRREKILPEPRAKEIYTQLLSAIDYLHNKGVVHRDIKCENLLFDKHNVLKLIDFGFSRANIENSTVLSDTYCGSYAYACPEILQGVPYETHYADIWASGVVLFSMVYGHLPFDDSNLGMLIKQVKSKLKFPKNSHTVSDECKHFIEKLISPYRNRSHIDQIRVDIWLDPKKISTSSEGSSKSSHSNVTSKCN